MVKVTKPVGRKLTNFVNKEKTNVYFKPQIIFLFRVGGGTIQEGGSDLSCIWWGVEEKKMEKILNL